MPDMIATGSAPIDFLLESGLLAALLLGLIVTVQRIARKHLSPTTKHALWIFLLLRMTLPELPSSPWSINTLTQRIPSVPIQKEKVEQGSALTTPRTTNSSSHLPTPTISNTEYPENPLPAAILPIETPPPSYTKPETATTFSSLTKNPNPVSISTPTAARGYTNTPKPTDTNRNPIPWTTWLEGLWITGMFILASRIMYKGRQLRKMLARASQIQTPGLTQILADQMKALGIRRSIAIYETSAVGTPALYGLVQHRILLPENFSTTYTPTELSHVLSHELAHVKRLDPLWNLWSTVIQIIHWPNPFVWYACKRMQGDRELATDYLALETGQAGDAKTYGETILKTLDAFHKNRMLPGLIGISEHRRNLRRRFSMISSFQRGKRYSIFAILAILLPLSIACLTDADPAQKNPSPTLPQTSLSTVSTAPLPIEASHSIQVTVRDATTEAALGGVPVYYTLDHSDVPQGWTLTNSEGVADLKIDNPVGQNHTLELSATPVERYSPKARRWSSLEEAWDTLPSQHRFHLDQGQRVGGTVLDPDGTPVSGARITLSQFSRSRPQVQHENATILHTPFELGIQTDSKGNWSYDGVPPAVETLYLKVREPNGAESRFTTGDWSIPELAYHFGEPVDGEQLRSGRARLILPERQTLTLQIMDETGNRIQGARVTEYFGTPRKVTGATRSTDASAQAHFTVRSKRELLFVATHPEYASGSLIAHPQKNHTAHRLVLHRQMPMRGKIVETDGSPVEGALIRLDGYLNDEFVSDWSAVTGPDGLFHWQSAPSTEIQLQVQCKGYQTVIVPATPSSDRTLIPLPSKDDYEITISVDVEDAETSEPLNGYEYLIGSVSRPSFRPWRAHPGGSLKIETSVAKLKQSTLNAHGGFYTIEIRAKGYYGYLSRQISQQETKPTLKIKLQPLPKEKRLAGLQITTSDGAPEPKAYIFAVGEASSTVPTFDYSNHSRMRVQNSNEFRFTTDSHGRLPDMPLPVGFRGIVVFGSNGMTTLSADASRPDSGRLQLSRPASFEGQLSIADWVQPNQTISLRNRSNSTPLYHLHATAKADDTGQFRFNPIPVGDYQLSVLHPRIPEQGRLSGPIQRTYQKSIRVEGHVGQTLDYTNTGREVTGKLVSDTIPKPINFTEGQFYLHDATTHLAKSQRPRGDQFVRWHSLRSANQTFIQDQFQATREGQRSYNLNLTPNGDFVIDAVPPGEYILSIDLHEPNARGRSPHLLGRQSIASLKKHVTIPESDSLAPVELGEIAINRAPKRPARIQHPAQPPKATITIPAAATTADGHAMIPPNTMRISVIDFVTGDPIPNAKVTLQTEGANTQGETSIFTTDASGLITIKWNQPTAHVRIRAEAKEYLGSQKVYTPKSIQPPNQYRFRMERGKLLYGRVQIASGEPVSGVKVAVYSFGGNRHQHSWIDPTDWPETNALGRWRFDQVPPDAEKVYVRYLHPSMAMPLADPSERITSPGSAAEHASRNRQLIIETPTATTRLPDMVLTPGGQLRGRVLDHNNRPIENAHLKILDSCCGKTTTNASGEFDFRGTYVGAIEMLITANGAAPRLVKIYAGPGMTPIDYQLDEGNRLIFDVRDPDGKPIPGVEIMAINPRLGGVSANPRGTTDDSGRCYWDSAPDMPVDYLFAKSGFEMHTEKYLTPKHQPYSITLRPNQSTSVKFTVSDVDGNPIPDFRIQQGEPSELPLSPYSINWNPSKRSQGYEGRHQIRYIHQTSDSDTPLQGHRIYRITAFGYQPQLTRVVEKDEQSPELKVTLRRADTTRGVLLAPTGTPLAKRNLRIITPSDRPTIQEGKLAPGRGNGKRLKTDSSGRFEFDPTPREATLLGVFPEGFSYARVAPQGEPIILPVQAWGQVKGQWLADGKPVPGKSLGLRIPTGSKDSRPPLSLNDRAITDEYGRFEFDRVPPGEIEVYELGAEQPMTATVTVPAGESHSLRLTDAH